MLFSSISRELLLVNILSFTIVVIGVGITVGVLCTRPNSVDNILAASNNVYVEVNRYVNRKDDDCAIYLKKLGKLYDVNIAIVDYKGNIILKSENVNTNIINLNYIQNRLTYGSGFKGDENLYQLYDVIINNEKAKLVVWKFINFSDGSIKYTCILLIPPITAVLLIYLLTRRKTKYIKSISIGINKISGGDLDYRIEKKGFDELGLLANKINSMAANLKSKIESEEAAEKLKGELITNVSHDLRTPLTSLIAYLQLIDNNKISTEEKKKYTKTSVEKAYKIKVLIDDLFEYSKLESGGVKLEKKEVNIVEIIEQSIGELAILAKKSNICFEKVYEIAELYLVVDPYKIARVFENILSNAIKYSLKESTVYIDIIEKNNNVIVSFENTTNDLLEEQEEKIFNRFYKVDKSRNSQIHGSGLGLAISKSIVNLHHGDIWAEIKKSKFKIYVKLKK